MWCIIIFKMGGRYVEEGKNCYFCGNEIIGVSPFIEITQFISYNIGNSLKNDNGVWLCSDDCNEKYYEMYHNFKNMF